MKIHQIVNIPPFSHKVWAQISDILVNPTKYPYWIPDNFGTVVWC